MYPLFTKKHFETNNLTFNSSDCYDILVSMSKFYGILSGCSGYHKGYGEKLRCSQAQPGQAITSAVAYFPSISCLVS